VAGLIAKLAPDVEIYSYKILNSRGVGDLSTIIMAYEWAAEDSVKLMNMSLGAKVSCCFSVLRLVHEQAEVMGIIPVYASGNYGEGTVACPAMIEDTISVGSVETDGDVSWFTSRGRACFFVEKPEIYAYGGGRNECVFSSWSPHSRLYPGMYACVMGTSQAAPQVTAALALFVQSFRESYGRDPSYSDVRNAVVRLSKATRVIRPDMLKAASGSILAQLILAAAILIIGEGLGGA